MIRSRQSIILILVLCAVSHLSGQQVASDSLTTELGFREYMGYVVAYHPLVRQAELTLDRGTAELLKARGGFDPKLELDLDRKKFKGTEYWDRLNAAFKVPTWYGVTLQAKYKQDEGAFLNPDETLPDEGLFEVGVSLSLADGLWIDKRMATLKKARFFRDQALFDQEIAVNEVLTAAAKAYFEWIKAYNELSIFVDFEENARIRLNGIKERARRGDLPVIDTVEAAIAVQNRILGKQQAMLNYRQRSLELSNFIWIEDIPVEITEDVYPEVQPDFAVDDLLSLNRIDSLQLRLEDHPKLQSLSLKVEGLRVERRLKVNQLLPTMDLEYNFLTTQPDQVSTYDTQQFTAGLKFRTPLFLRKERGALRLADIKLREAEWELENQRWVLSNKIDAVYAELANLGDQRDLSVQIRENYQKLLSAEERKFSFGESSIFLLNSREQSLIDASLKLNEVYTKWLKSKAKLFNTLVLTANP